jgi:NADH-quinone oxidoreductase subunit C
MLNKKIHQDFVKNRAAVASPEAQARLRDALISRFSNELTEIEKGAWEYNLAFGLERENALSVFKILKDEAGFNFDMLIDVTAVDWMDRREPRFDVVYQLLSLKHAHRVMLKIQTGEENPEVDSVVSLWRAANFLEREVWDMYGISFKGHGDLRRILMYDEFVGHPLRKDYPLRGKQPRVELRVPELRNTADDMHRDVLIAMPRRAASQ